MNPVALNIRSAYLAGPMRGIQEYNFPRFKAAARWLRGMGWDIYSPAERDEDDAVALENHERHREIDQWGTALPLDYYMEFDLAAVCRTDAVILLPDWEESQGARLEARVATELGHPVFRLVTEDNDAYALLSVDPTEVNMVFLRGGELTEPSEAGGVDMSDDIADLSFTDIANRYFEKRDRERAAQFDAGDACDCDECLCATQGAENTPAEVIGQMEAESWEEARPEPKIRTTPEYEAARWYGENVDQILPDPWASEVTGIQSDEDGVMRLQGQVVFGDTIHRMDGTVDEDATKMMRTFETGATRNVETDPDYHGFISPLALHAYGDYMHRHRLQADGTLRDSDNWQKGIPNDAFVRSLVRHVHDIQLIHDGYGELARTDDRDENVLLSHLAAALFNVQGMLHNVLKANLEEEV